MAVTLADIERHKLPAGECPPQSEVVLASSLRRLLDRAATAAAGVPRERSGLTFTLREADSLLHMFGGEQGEITVRKMDGGAIHDDPTDPVDEGPSPAGLWGHMTEYPEEGCVFLGAADPLEDYELAAAPAVPRERDVRLFAKPDTERESLLQAALGLARAEIRALRNVAAVPREDARPKWRHADGGLYDVLTLNAMFKSIGYDEWQDGYVVYRDDSNQVYVTSKARFDKRFTRVPDAAIANREGKVSEITKDERHILEHSLGISDGRSKRRPYRNHFVTGEGSTDWPVCTALAERGLMRKFQGSQLSGGDPVFVVTKEGCALLGVEPPK